MEKIEKEQENNVNHLKSNENHLKPTMWNFQKRVEKTIIWVCRRHNRRLRHKLYRWLCALFVDEC